MVMWMYQDCLGNVVPTIEAGLCLVPSWCPIYKRTEARVLTWIGEELWTLFLLPAWGIHLIHILSFPKGDGVAQEMVSVKYIPFEEAVGVERFRRGVLLAKGDIKPASQLLPAYPQARDLLDVPFQGQYC